MGDARILRLENCGGRSAEHAQLKLCIVNTVISAIGVALMHGGTRLESVHFNVVTR